ncbi:type II toxin-antitoxin system VapC family toxin [Oscillatoria laete-virens NRMC-F 0139]|nr:type II toxin-antitoxin system VapC family toxin [Oscillatoria laete-virens]MDL5053959.1 type II toxin-antitoxin system VapC family toxin [Oscillatoria laete-virens NRMC-F 0139]
MAAKVIDSWALIAFFEDEHAADEVEKILNLASARRHKLFMSAVNWGEVYCATMRKTSRAVADQLAGQIASLPIEIVGVSEDLHMVRQASLYKASYKMSYADCFAAALAKDRKAELITGDPEFKNVENEIKIHWLK